MAKWTVYVLHDADDRPFYVGVTRDLSRRLREHKKVFGFKPTAVVLEVGEGDRGSAEHRWIETYRLDGIVLLNKTAGGNGMQIGSAEMRLKLSLFHRGRAKPPGHAESVGKAQRGKPKNWTPKGIEALAIAGARGSRKFWDGLSLEQRAVFVERKAISIRKASRTDAFRAKIATISRERWSKCTPDERSALGKAVAASRARNRTNSELSEIARRNAIAGRDKDPQYRERMSNQVKSWWARLTPDAKADFIARRSARIKAARQVKSK